MSRLLVLPHEAAIAEDVGAEYGGELTFQYSPQHATITSRLPCACRRGTRDTARDAALHRQRYCLSQTETTDALLPLGASSVMVSSFPSFDTARFDVRITLPFFL